MSNITAIDLSEVRRVQLEGLARVDRARDVRDQLLNALDAPSGQTILEIDLTGVEEADLSLFQLLYAAGRTARGVGVDRVLLKASGGVLRSIDLFGLRAGLAEAGVVVVDVSPTNADGSDSNGT